MRESAIYLKADMPLSGVADLVQRELGLALRFTEERGDAFYVGLDGDRRITLGQNDFTDPQFAPLSEYTYELAVDGSEDAPRVRYARDLFAQLTRLRQLRQVPLLLVDNLVPLDRYEPS